jgi:hypothetical protein
VPDAKKQSRLRLWYHIRQNVEPAISSQRHEGGSPREDMNSNFISHALLDRSFSVNIAVANGTKILSTGSLLTSEELCETAMRNLSKSLQHKSAPTMVAAQSQIFANMPLNLYRSEERLKKSCGKCVNKWCRRDFSLITGKLFTTFSPELAFPPTQKIILILAIRS